MNTNKILFIFKNSAVFAITAVAVAISSGSLPTYGKIIEVPWTNSKQNLYIQHVWQVPGTTRVLRIGIITPYHGDTAKGLTSYQMCYQISTDSGKTYDALRPLIQHGSQYGIKHPIKGVYLGINSYAASVPPPTLASNGEIMVPFYYWPLDESGEHRLHAENAWGFLADGVLIGHWNKDKTDLNWMLGQTVFLDYKTQSRRGAMEPAIIELDQPGHFLMVMRASNQDDPKMKSYKWKAVSNDYCRTWSKPMPLAYADGKNFFSPSACSVIMRSSKNGKIYWFGNISPKNAAGNSPRYPLVVAQIDEKTLGLIKSTIRVIDTWNPAIDTPKIQLSNFKVRENSKTGAFVVTLTRIDTGKIQPGQRHWVRKWPKMRYVVPLDGEVKTTITVDPDTTVYKTLKKMDLDWTIQKKSK